MAKIGDIFEIHTPSGLAYVQYTHETDLGPLVRVLPGLFPNRPTDFAQLAKEKELYFVFYNVKTGLRDGQTEIVSHQAVPEWALPYPLMRWTSGLQNENGCRVWKIFRASDRLSFEMHQKTPIIRTLTPDQQKLSIYVLRPHPAMVKELARRWTPERAEEFRLQDVADAQAKKAETEFPKASPDDLMQHFLYLPSRANAEKVEAHLRGDGFSVEVRRGADGKNWLALATKSSPQTGMEMSQLRDAMESLAKRFGGEYDGWQAKVSNSPVL